MINFIQSHKSDLYITLAILFCALLLRVPAFDYPDSTIADEGVSIFFTTTTINRTPFFEPSPPLSWMIYRAIVPDLGVGYPNLLLIGFNLGFRDFPYKPIRLAEIYIGTILVTELYLISRLLGSSKYLSATLAFLAILDNTLIMYSRTISPDGFLLFFGMTGILFLLISLRFNHWISRIIGLLIAGFTLGLSGSIKWTGFGFLAAGLVWLFLKKKWYFIPVVLATGIIAYFATFYVYFGMMDKGSVDLRRSFYHTKAIKSFVFPGPDSSLKERIKSTVEYSKISYITHAGDEGEVDRRVTNDTGSVARWPLSMSGLVGWYSQKVNARLIIFYGNPFVWSLGIISFLIVLFNVLNSLLKRNMPDKVNAFLVVAFLGTYLPFTLVSRHLFMYTYLPSLLFSLLMLPRAVVVLWPYISHKLNNVSIEQFEKFIFYLVLVPAILIFLSVSPMTYGF
jgi:dolichyl-phosphate-mannose--protein O-mannosyl transferase